LTVLAAIALAAVFPAGCAAPKAPDTPYDLEIQMWKSGVGSDYVKKINEEFRKAHPEITIHLTETASMAAMAPLADTRDNTVDLYFTAYAGFLAYKQWLEPLGDVAAARPDGEGKATIGEKFGGLIDLLMPPDAEGNLYTLPYAATVNGIAYNADVFAQKGYKPPRTTDELQDLCDDMISDRYTPFIYFHEYWQYLFSPWIAQLEGLDRYYELFESIYTDENGVKHPNDLRAARDYAPGSGRYESLKVLRELLGRKDNSYYGASTMSHTVSQTYFLNGAALMLPNGSWMENEMKDVSTAQRLNAGMMKVPVISALGKKLGITETQLRAAVALADGEATAQETAVADALTEGQREAVRTARQMLSSQSTGLTALIPNYSNAKAAAKEYLKFYYSDQGMKIMAETTHMPLPLTLSADVPIDRSSWSNFSKDCYRLSQEMTLIHEVLRSKIQYSGGVHRWFYNANVAQLFAYSQNTADMYELDAFIKLQQDNWTNYWPVVMDAIGS
jgi:N-acetylglucosamine transport system substrate-binding protein